MKKPEDIEHILEVIVDIASEFLQSEIGITVEKTNQKAECSSYFRLKPYTALMSISGSFSMNVTFSFDTSLIEQVYKVYCHELEIEDDERLAHIDETASDMINIVIGNSTSKLAHDGTVVQISVPIVINEASSISIRDVKFLTTTLFTGFGDMMITAMPNTCDYR
ncbi:MAG: chemotaxis protein CheX [Algicola sp.]|nr:chemotaxis protein CheX [Algicola sp.]